MSPTSPTDSAILAQLAQALLGTMFDGSATLVVGRTPDGWPPSLVPPEAVSTLGGLIGGATSMAVFVYPTTADRPFEEYRALIESRGWVPASGMGDSGFDSTRIAMLCRDSSLVTLRRPTPDSADTSIIVAVAPCDGWPCRPDARIPRHEALQVPRLAAPVGVRWDGGGGSSGGGDHLDTRIRVTTDLTPAELLPLYAAQLADAGWRLGAVHDTATHAIQWVEANDRKGHPWRGLLTIYVNGQSDGHAREVFIYMAKTVA